MLVRGGNLQTSPGSVLEQDVCRMMLHSEIIMIYEVLTKFRDNGGMRALDKRERKIFREIADIEHAAKQEDRRG